MSVDVRGLIDQLNATDEHERIEAKTGLGTAAMKTVVAFSNEPRLDGGYVVFGVSKTEDSEAPQYEVVGVSDPDKLSSDFSSQCATMLNRRIRPRVKTEIMDGRPVVAAYVPEVQPAQKPVFIESEGLDEGVYRRIGPTDQGCTDDDLEEIYQERSGDTYDASIVSGADLEDINSDAVEDYRETRAQVDPEADELSLEDRDLLRALRCVEKQRGRLRITFAATTNWSGRVCGKATGEIKAHSGGHLGVWVNGGATSSLSVHSDRLYPRAGERVDGGSRPAVREKP